jgi:hypothetical protein
LALLAGCSERDATSLMDAAALDDAGGGAPDAVCGDAGARDAGETATDAGPMECTGDTCADAIAIAPGAPPPPGSTIGCANDYAWTDQPRDGRDRVYVTDVPAGRELAVTVRWTDASYRPSVEFIAAGACTTRTPPCLASGGVGGPGASTTYYRNTSTSMQTMFVVVDSLDAMDPGGTYTLEVALE